MTASVAVLPVVTVPPARVAAASTDVVMPVRLERRVVPLESSLLSSVVDSVVVVVLLLLLRGRCRVAF